MKKNSFLSDFAYSFFISFVAGFIAAIIVVNLYTSFVWHQPKFYSFNLSGVLSKEETLIMKDSKVDLKKQITRYMSTVSDYVNSYASRGIVFVSGAVVGNSPYVQDITGGFFRVWNSRSGAGRATR